MGVFAKMEKLPPKITADKTYLWIVNEGSGIGLSRCVASGNGLGLLRKDRVGEQGTNYVKWKFWPLIVNIRHYFALLSIFCFSFTVSKLMVKA